MEKEKMKYDFSVPKIRFLYDNDTKITLLRKNEPTRKNAHDCPEDLKAGRAGGHKSREARQREQLRTIQKDRARGYKSREAGQREQPRTIQKDRARGYKSREARQREQPRTI